jgi:hypothetical protein
VIAFVSDPSRKLATRTPGAARSEAVSSELNMLRPANAITAAARDAIAVISIFLLIHLVEYFIFLLNRLLLGMFTNFAQSFL